MNRWNNFDLKCYPAILNWNILVALCDAQNTYSLTPADTILKSIATHFHSHSGYLPSLSTLVLFRVAKLFSSTPFIDLGEEMHLESTVLPKKTL